MAGMKTLAMASGLAVAAVAGAATFLGGDREQNAAATGAAETPAAPAAETASETSGDSKIAGGDPAADSETETARAVPVSETPAEESRNAPSETSGGAGDIEFSLGSMEDLRATALTALAEKIDKVPGVADDTKVWTATADVARTQGDETIFLLKGPLTCGRLGCDIAVVGADGSVLLQTFGETVSSPEIDTLIVSAGTGEPATWTFNGETFVESD